MAKKKKKYNLKSRITSALRRIWFYGPSRREAVKAAKDAGNKCAICNEHFEKLQADHITPVVPTKGFDNWDSYIDRLFNGQLRMICKDCHGAVTKISREIRKKSIKVVDKKRK